MRDQAILVTGAADFIGLMPADDPAAANAPSKVYNVGNHHPEELTRVVGVLEPELGRTAIKELLPMQPEDPLETFADVEDLMRDTGFAPSMPIAHGIRNSVTWYRNDFKV
jgi:UDP-glucuronate 4-epimerase